MPGDPASASVTTDDLQERTVPGRLAAAVRAHHEVIRRSPSVSAIAVCRLPWPAYAEWLAQRWFMHEALAQAEALWMAGQADPDLTRSTRVSLPALAADLRFLYGPAWQRRITAYPQTTAYCTHLRDVALRGIGGFTAHHCARHAADFLLAPLLASAAAVAYGLDDAGVRFVAAPADMNLARFVGGYDRVLRHGQWTPAQADVLLADIADVHRMELAIVRAFERTWRPGMPTW